jgi:hypothetical protein
MSSRASKWLPRYAVLISFGAAIFLPVAIGDLSLLSEIQISGQFSVGNPLVPGYKVQNIYCLFGGQSILKFRKASGTT